MNQPFQLNSAKELFEDSTRQKLSFLGDLLPDYFGVVDVNSNIVFLNKPALHAVQLTLDQVIGNQYTCFKTNIVELAESFFEKDKIVISRDKTVCSASWSEFGEKNEWSFLIGKRKLIYDINHNVIGISSYFSNFNEVLLPPLLKFFNEKKTSYFKGLAKHFDFELCEEDRIFNLSKRETEVLFYILYGRTNKEISEHLDLSCRSIESYVDSIKNKINVSTKSQLIEKSINAGYLGTFPTILLKKIVGINF